MIHPNPADPDFEERIRKSFALQGLMAAIDAELSLIRAGEVHISAPFNERLTQQDGFLHAGIVTSLVDTACGYASYTLMPADSRVLSIEFKVNFLLPARGERFRAEGQVARSGKTISVCEGRLFALQDGQESLVAMMQATMICVHNSKPA